MPRRVAMLPLLLGGAAVHRCDNWVVFSASALVVLAASALVVLAASALQTAEKLELRIRVSLQRYHKSGEIRRPFRGWWRDSTLSANCLAADLTVRRRKHYFRKPLQPCQ